MDNDNTINTASDAAQQTSDPQPEMPRDKCNRPINAEGKTAQKRKAQRKPNDEIRKAACAQYLADKTKPRASAGYFPNSDEAIHLEMGDNAKYTAFALAIYQMEPIDITDSIQVQRRVVDYLSTCIEHDIKPGIANLAMALGVDRNRLRNIVYGLSGSNSGINNDVRSVIKKAYALFDSMWETNMQSGKINPACGIFLGTNNFGYRDARDYNITPKQDKEQISADQLNRRLEALPDDD